MSYPTNRVAILNTSNNEVTTTLFDVDHYVFSVLWDVHLGHIVLPDDLNSDYIEVSLSAKLGKDKVKISAPMAYWQFAIQVQSLVKQARNNCYDLYGSLPSKYGKKLVIKRKNA